MAKESGLGNALYVAGIDLSGITKNWSVSGGPNMLDVTDITQSAPARIGGLLSGKVKYVTHFDPVSAGHLHESSLPTTNEDGMLPHRATVGMPAWAWTAKQIGWDPKRDHAGAVDFTVDAQSTSYGVDCPVMLTSGQRTDVAATNGTGVDHGLIPPGSYGLQAYLQVFAVSGGTPTVKLQGSSDDAVGDPYADITGASFGAISATGAYRLATSRTLAVERWCRVITTGAFTSITFACGVTINDCAVPIP